MGTCVRLWTPAAWLRKDMAVVSIPRWVQETSELYIWASFFARQSESEVYLLRSRFSHRRNSFCGVKVVWKRRPQKNHERNPAKIQMKIYLQIYKNTRQHFRWSCWFTMFPKTLLTVPSAVKGFGVKRKVFHSVHLNYQVLPWLNIIFMFSRLSVVPTCCTVAQLATIAMLSPSCVWGTACHGTDCRGSRTRLPRNPRPLPSSSPFLDLMAAPVRRALQTCLWCSVPMAMSALMVQRVAETLMVPGPAAMLPSTHLWV